MKKLLTLLAAALLTISIVACNQATTDTPEDTTIPGNTTNPDSTPDDTTITKDYYNHSVTLATLTKAANVLGKKLVLQLQ